MSKCKICGNEINLVIFGLPDDVCWGCASKEKKDDVIEKNVNLKKNVNLDKKKSE